MLKPHYCDLCESYKCNKKLHESIEEAIKECHEGRTYTMSCKHYKGKGFFVCWKCVVEDCEKWYNLGKKDERKRLKNG